MPRHPAILLPFVFLGALALSAPPASADTPTPDAAEFFEKQVRPLLVERCLQCHGDTKPKGGLKLISRASLLEGGNSGPVVVPGKPDESLLIQAVRYRETPKMPPEEKLQDRDVEVLARWVRLGLPWPEAAVIKLSDAGPKGQPFHISDEQRRFWAFQPVREVSPPEVKDIAWCRTEADRFILAALEAKGLHPARPANKRTLIRRATFDLTGLPPTPEAVDAFSGDDSPDAFARVVDRLLASPQYGERWGRHWLDLVRYADSFDARGIGGEGDISEAWRYRDWVVDAFNSDLPYDEFIRQQIAGDLLPAPTPGDVHVGGIVATGILAIGNWGGGDADKEKLLTDIADDQLDVVGRSILGLTIACARCHDHKFDPISQADYYGLAGIFFSRHILPTVGAKTAGPPMLRIPLLTVGQRAQRERYQARIAELEKQKKTATGTHYTQFAKDLRPQTARYLVAAWDYQHRPTELAGLSPDAFAVERGLHGFALRQWLGELGPADYRPMTIPIHNVNGQAGIHAWKGAPDCPSLTVNSTEQDVTILTFRLPARSVSVHPGPTDGVVVAWRSPITGKVRIDGRVRDADPVGGDGIAWAIDHRQAAGRHELASGDFPNGGSQEFKDGKTAEQLREVEVRAGDMLELVVLPKANHICDTTVVDLTIATADGARVWNLAQDVVDDLLQGGKGNPHTDRSGQPAVWHFLDMAGNARGPRTTSIPALAPFEQALRQGDRRAVERAAEEFQKTFDMSDARSPFRIRRLEDEPALPVTAREDLARLTAELAALKAKPLPPIPIANGAQEGGVPGSPHAGVHDVAIHLRGSYSRLGEVVPRRFPVILAGEHQPAIRQGSGRLELARWLTRPDHPLTSRVLANRLWQYHFGQGIVRTPSNFGKLGEPPTHPELLDFLASQLVRAGWSMKAMHRLIMLSAAYQQESEPDPATLREDPDNRLFGRMNRRRLEAEAVRDSLLAVSGRLDATPGGPATRDFASPRRTLYQMTIRSDRSGFGPLFDSADSTAPVERRTVSTVAPQALFLMNDPFALNQAKALARRVMREEGDEAARLRRLYVLLYARPPDPEEERVGLDFLHRATERAWEEYCAVLLCANEFLYVD